jgi:hypothetical protein
MNGFFVVLGRLTGKLLSAKDYTYLNWGQRIDLETGRPVLTAQADWYGSPKNIYLRGPGHGTFATRTELVPARA